MASVRKSEQALAKYERAGLTKDGKAWIIQSVDPFHDLPIMPIGIPDGNTDQSVPLLVKRELQLNWSGTNNWDCSIWLDQILRPYTTTAGAFTAGGGALLPNSNPSVALGGINAISVDSGMSTDFSTTALPPGLLVRSLPLPDQYTQGLYSISAIGFEVYNTTSDLYKQGSVLVWRMPNAQAQRDTMFNLRGYPLLAEVHPLPPRDIAAARQLTNSKQWEAKEGCYVVAAMDGEWQGARLPERRAVVRSDTLDQQFGHSQATIDGTFLSNDLVPYSYSVNGTTYDLELPSAVVTHPFSMCGAYFTGLSPQTTLTLVVNYYLERYPTQATADLIPLARPRPRYDPLALEIYSQIIGDMPPGVPVKDNGLGTWFAEAVSNIAPYVSGALSAIPHPIAQGAALAAKTAGKVADTYLVQASPAQDATVRKAKAKKKRQKAKAQAQAALQPRRKGG